MKAKKSYKKGGAINPPKGRPGSKKKKPIAGPTEEDYIRGERMARPDLDKIEPLQAKRIKNDAAMKAMVTSPKVRRSTATIPVPAKKKRRRKFENGGKVIGAKTEKSRAGKSYVLRENIDLIKKREQGQLERSVRESRRAKRINEAEARRAKARPDYRPKKKLEEGLRDDDGRILRANKLGRKDVTKLEATSPKKEIKKSTAKIPVPAKKRRLRLRRRK